MIKDICYLFFYLGSAYVPGSICMIYGSRNLASIPTGGRKKEEEEETAEFITNRERLRITLLGILFLTWKWQLLQISKRLPFIKVAIEISIVRFFFLFALLFILYFFSLAFLPRFVLRLRNRLHSNTF